MAHIFLGKIPHPSGSMGSQVGGGDAGEIARSQGGGIGPNEPVPDSTEAIAQRSEYDAMSPAQRDAKWGKPGPSYDGEDIASGKVKFTGPKMEPGDSQTSVIAPTAGYSRGNNASPYEGQVSDDTMITNGASTVGPISTVTNQRPQSEGGGRPVANGALVPSQDRIITPTDEAGSQTLATHYAEEKDIRAQAKSLHAGGPYMSNEDESAYDKNMTDAIARKEPPKPKPKPGRGGIN